MGGSREEKGIESRDDQRRVGVVAIEAQLHIGGSHWGSGSQRKDKALGCPCRHVHGCVGRTGDLIRCRVSSLVSEGSRNVGDRGDRTARGRV